MVFVCVCVCVCLCVCPRRCAASSARGFPNTRGAMRGPSQLGTSFPAPITQCLTTLAAQSEEDIMRAYGLTDSDAAKILRTRASGECDENVSVVCKSRRWCAEGAEGAVRARTGLVRLCAPDWGLGGLCCHSRGTTPMSSKAVLDRCLCWRGFSGTACSSLLYVQGCQTKH